MSKQALWSALSNDAALAALVGTRIYPRHLPDGVEVPAVVYKRLFEDPASHLNGPASLDLVRYQVDSWALSEGTVEPVRLAVRTALEGAGFTFLDSRDVYEDDTRRFGVQQSFWYAEAR